MDTFDATNRWRVAAASFPPLRQHLEVRERDIARSVAQLRRDKRTTLVEALRVLCLVHTKCDESTKKRLLPHCMQGLAACSFEDPLDKSMWTTEPSSSEWAALIGLSVLTVSTSSSSTTVPHDLPAACAKVLFWQALPRSMVCSLLIDLLWESSTSSTATSAAQFINQLVHALCSRDSACRRTVGELLRRAPAIILELCSGQSVTDTTSQALKTRTAMAALHLSIGGAAESSWPLQERWDASAPGSLSVDDSTALGWHPWRGRACANRLDHDNEQILHLLIEHFARSPSQGCARAVKDVGMSLQAASIGLAFTSSSRQGAAAQTAHDLYPIHDKETVVRQSMVRGRKLLRVMLVSLGEHDDRATGAVWSSTMSRIAAGSLKHLMGCLALPRLLWTQSQLLLVTDILRLSLKCLKSAERLSTTEVDDLREAALMFLAILYQRPKAVMLQGKGDFETSSASATLLVQSRRFQSELRSTSSHTWKQFEQVREILGLFLGLEATSLPELALVASVVAHQRGRMCSQLPRDEVRAAVVSACCLAVSGFIQEQTNEMLANERGVRALELVAGEICVYADSTSGMELLCTRLGRSMVQTVVDVALHGHLYETGQGLVSLCRRVCLGATAAYDGLPHRRALLARLSWMILAQVLARRPDATSADRGAISASAREVLALDLVPSEHSHDNDIASLAVSLVAVSFGSLLGSNVLEMSQKQGGSKLNRSLCYVGPKLFVRYAALALDQMQTAQCVDFAASVGDLLPWSVAGVALNRTSLVGQANAGVSLQAIPCVLREMAQQAYDSISGTVYCDPMVYSQVWCAQIAEEVAATASLSDVERVLLLHCASQCAVESVTRAAASQLQRDASSSPLSASSSSSSSSTRSQVVQASDSSAMGYVRAETAAAMALEARAAVSGQLILRRTTRDRASRKEAVGSPVAVMVRAVPDVEGDLRPSAWTRLREVVARALGCIRAAELREKICQETFAFPLEVAHGDSCMCSVEPASAVLMALCRSAGEPETPIGLLGSVTEHAGHASVFPKLASLRNEQLQQYLGDLMQAVARSASGKQDLAGQWARLSNARAALGPIGIVLHALVLGIPAADARGLARRKSLAISSLSMHEQPSALAVMHAFEQELANWPIASSVRSVLANYNGMAIRHATGVHGKIICLLRSENKRVGAQQPAAAVGASSAMVSGCGEEEHGSTGDGGCSEDERSVGFASMENDYDPEVLAAISLDDDGSDGGQ